MRQTKRKLMTYQLYDHTGIERYLERMALDGWKLEHIGGLGIWKFRRIEPKPLHYTVTYFPDASEFDPGVVGNQTEFVELCAAAGWTFVGKQAQMMVFCSERPNPVPLETDAVVQVDTVHKAMKKNFLPGQIVLLVLAVVQLLMLGYRLKREFFAVVTTDALLVSAFCYLLILVMSTVHLAAYYYWRKQAILAAPDGVFVETKSTHPIDQGCLLLVVAVVAVWMYSLRYDSQLLYMACSTMAVIIGVLLAVNGLKLLLQRFGVDRETNRAVSYILVVVGTVAGIALVTETVLKMDEPVAAGKEPVGSYEYAGSTYFVYEDEIPLTLEQLGIEVTYANKSNVEEINRSLLIKQYVGSEKAPWGVSGVPELYYTLTVPALSCLWERCLEDILNQYMRYGEYHETDSELWQAQQVYEYAVDGEPNGYYIVVWEERILQINYPEIPTEEQITVTVEALKAFEVQ